MQALLDNQISAIEKLRHYKVGALFMEPGTGKTRTAMELVCGLSEIDNFVWLTPFRNQDNLKRELITWGTIANYNRTSVYGIESLSNSDRIYLDVTNKINESTCLIVDESLKIKNWTAKRTKRIVELGRRCQYKLILNGTPLSRNLLDIWTQMEFLSPMILNMDLARFENTFCEWKQITKRMGHRASVQKFITKYHNVDHLYSLIGHYVFECDLTLDTSKQHIDVEYHVGEEERKEYQELKTKYLDNEKLQFLNNNIFIEMTQKMQHGYCCTESKFDCVNRILSEYDNRKVLVYTKFIASREELKKRWPELTVLSYGMHSFGLNLQDYNVTIYFDKSFDYAPRIQSEHRTYRTGQKETCYYYDLTGDVGLETMINKNISKKQDLAQYFKSKSVKQIISEL